MKKILNPLQKAFPGLILASALLTGCAHSKNKDLDPAFLGGAAVSPMPPPFLNGPMGLLLTNASGYSAHVTMQNQVPAGKPELLSGDLLCLGAKLLFSPIYDRASDKNFRTADISFVWDAAGNSGFILSEALQGYAPLTGAARYTNVITAPGTATAQDGKLMSVAAADGSVTDFRVALPAGSHGPPNRIVTPPAAPTVVVTFSKIRTEPPPAILFQPPDGFTRYPSAEAMMGELAMRRHNLKKR